METKYRKKPIVIEAVQVTQDYLKGKPNRESFTIDDGKEYNIFYLEDRVLIETLEGIMEANIGDFIITGHYGEKYPCRGDVFRDTYEPVKDVDSN